MKTQPQVNRQHLQKTENPSMIAVIILLAGFLISFLTAHSQEPKPTIKFVRWEMGASKPDTITAILNKTDTLTANFNKK